MLRAAIAPEFERKAAAEKSWPEVTDCDRLDDAFEELNSSGIIALQDAGTTISDGISDVSEIWHRRGKKGVRGYCFYHGQDLERAIHGDGLTIAFGDMNDDQKEKAAIGVVVSEVLKRHGFEVEWNGDPETRLDLPTINWQRRLSTIE